VSVVLLAEGRTEKVLAQHVKRFLDQRAVEEKRPKMMLISRDIMNLNAGKLRGRIRRELGMDSVTAVVGLVDVYPHLASASEAKEFLREAAGGEKRFFAHAAQWDVEAWLLPYWDAICARLGDRNHPAPGPHPEQVDHDYPPSRRLKDLYRTTKGWNYVKPQEFDAILRDKDLTIAAQRCPELKSFLNTLLKLGGLNLLP
jgi:hypothetical protein